MEIRKALALHGLQKASTLIVGTKGKCSAGDTLRWWMLLIDDVTESVRLSWDQFNMSFGCGTSMTAPLPELLWTVLPQRFQHILAN
jgi:hypothetical protein